MYLNGNLQRSESREIVNETLSQAEHRVLCGTMKNVTSVTCNVHVAAKKAAGYPATTDSIRPAGLTPPG